MWPVSFVEVARVTNGIMERNHDRELTKYIKKYYTGAKILVK
jgi:hypothetical protein